MNILYINHYAGSPEMGMEFRPYYLAREWVKIGHKVTIIAASYSHLRKHNPNVVKNYDESIIDGIKYIWIKTDTYNGNGISRAKTMFQFVHRIKSNANKIMIEENPDIVITSSTYPLDTYAGQKLKKINPNLKLIHEVHDMWPLTPMLLGGMSKYNPFIYVMQKAEDSAYRNSDNVVSLLSNSEGYMKKHGLADGKFYCIPNGVVQNEWKVDKIPPERHIELLTKLRKDGFFIVGYFGGHAISNALDIALEAACMMKNEKVAFVFVGEGVEKERLRKKSVELALDNVYFLPGIEKACVPKLLEFTDCDIVLGYKSELAYYGVSQNKVFDYMMAGKPVIFAITTVNPIVEAYNCGLYVDSQDYSGICKAIRKLMKMDEIEIIEMGNNGKEAVMNNFTYNKLANDFINIMNGRKQ